MIREGRQLLLFKGFSLVELLVVIAIMAILAGIVLVSARSSREAAKIARAKVEDKQIYYAFTTGIINTRCDCVSENQPGYFSYGRYTLHGIPQAAHRAWIKYY